MHEQGRVVAALMVTFIYAYILVFYLHIDIVAYLWSKSCCGFPKLHLHAQNKTGSLLKEKVCVNICTDFCLSKKVCSASWGCSIRSLVICRLLTLLFIKCAFHKWHRSSLWPPPSQTLTYYVGCDQATNRLAKMYLQANAQSSEKKKDRTDISYKIFAQEWHSCIMVYLYYLCVRRFRIRKTECLNKWVSETTICVTMKLRKAFQ